jgi:hypothetical protein
MHFRAQSGRRQTVPEGNSDGTDLQETARSSPCLHYRRCRSDAICLTHHPIRREHWRAHTGLESGILGPGVPILGSAPKRKKGALAGASSGSGRWIRLSLRGQGNHRPPGYELYSSFRTCRLPSLAVQLAWWSPVSESLAYADTHVEHCAVRASGPGAQTSGYLLGPAPLDPQAISDRLGDPHNQERAPVTLASTCA